MSLPVGVGHHPSFIFVTQNGCLSRCLFIAHSDAVRTAISFHHSDAPFCYDWFSSPQLRLCRSLATPTLAARSVRRARSLVSLLSLLCFSQLHKMGVSGAHGLVPRNDLWCTGPSPRTAEDHPLSCCACCHYCLQLLFLFSFSSFYATRLWRSPIFSLTVLDLCRAPLAQPNILLSLNLIILFATYYFRSPISCFLYLL